ncbi:MAG: mechanosensitive ion channel [Bacteroidota bacterium]|nr:mechanosensitive ion channel [Bacteroidota bacterium]
MNQPVPSIKTFTGKAFSFWFLFLLSFTISGEYSFGQVSDTDTIKVVEPELIYADEIANKLPEANSEMRKIHKSLISNKELEIIRVELDSFFVDYDLFKKELTASDTGKVERRELENRMYQWNQKKILNNRFQAQLNDILNELKKGNDALQTIESTWNRSLEAFPEELPKANKDLVSSFLFDLTAINDTLAGKIQLVMLQLERTTETNISIDEKLSTIQVTVEEIENTLLNTKGPALHRVLFNKEKEDKILGSITVNFKRNMLPVLDYMNNNKFRFLIILFIFVFIYGILIFIKRNTDLTPREEDQYFLINRALKLLSLPLPTSIFISLIITRLMSPLAPIDYYKIIFVLTLIPLMILIPKLLDKALNKYIYGIGIIFLIANLVDLTLYGFILSNLFLILLAIALVFGLIDFLRNKSTSLIFMQKFTRSFLNGFIFLSIFILSLTIISTFFGYYVFEEFIINAFIWVYFSIFLFYTANIILSGFVDLLILSRYMQKFNVFKKYATDISSWFIKTLNILTMLLWAYVAAILFKVDRFFEAAFQKILDFGINTGNIDFSVGHLVIFIITIWISFLIARVLRTVLEEDVLNKLKLERGVPRAISILAKYLVVIFGFFIAVAAAGMELNKLAFIFGALGVGIGFGLQSIVNNFISGLILLFERPIHIGDTIGVGTLEGTVKSIGMRASVIQTFDRSEVIVPNGNLVSNEVINWTLSNKMRRLEIKVGVAYGSDIEQVLKILKECAESHELVLKDPPPYVWFTNFGDSSLDFRLLFFYPQYNGGLTVRTEVASAVDKALKKAKITIPFPQTDVHIKQENTKTIK